MLTPVVSWSCSAALLVCTRTIHFLCVFSTYHADNEYALFNDMEKGVYAGLLFTQPFILSESFRLDLSP